MKNLMITTPKPRNNLVALARFRRAGVHRSSETSRRQQSLQSVKRELDRLKHSP